MTYQDQIKEFIDTRGDAEGLTETGIEGVKLFRVTQPVPCAPVVYEPSIVAIAGGAKEVVMNGTRCVYDHTRYLCCPMSMPVQAGTYDTSADKPLCGVYISLKPRMMTELTLEIDSAGHPAKSADLGSQSQTFQSAKWDEPFSDALLRLLHVSADPIDMAVLGEARLRELCYAVLKGQAGAFARQSFGVGNAIARSISYVSSNLNKPIAIDELADRAGMSRAVFHRKFKQATTLSPIQFVKTMRLNHAAMKMSAGASVNEAAMEVGYLSPSQFSREFKRLYGQSPRQWSEIHQGPLRIA